MEGAGIKTMDQNIHWPLVTKAGVNEADKKIHYHYNYSSIAISLTYPHKKGTELINNKSVTSGSTIEIELWGVLIIEEN